MMSKNNENPSVEPVDEQSPAAAFELSARQVRAAAFPEWLGIALAGTVLLGIVGVATAAYFALQSQTHAARAEERQALAHVVAGLTNQLDRENTDAIETVFRSLLGHTPALRSVEWRGADGALVASWPKTIATGTINIPGTTTATPTAVNDGTIFESCVTATDGTAAGTVRLTFGRLAAPQPSSALLNGGALSALVALIAFILIYRQLRSQLRPYDAIRQNLFSFAAGMERELVALSLSDSLGRVAQAWNHLLDQVGDLRSEDDEPESADLATDAMRRFESRTLRGMLERLPVGVIRFAADKRVTYANPAAARLLGQDLSTLVGAPFSETVEEEIHAPLIGAFTRSTAGISVDRKRGTEEQQITLRFSLVPALTGSADTEAMITIEDVSHIQEAERARDNFLYHVTHELRTPLTNIQAYAETLTGPGFDDEDTRRECYNVIISETRRLSRLVEDILNVSQLEVGTARMDMGHIDLVRLVRQIVQDHLGAADEKQIDLTLKLAPKVPHIKGDKQRLSVLITNLIGNAVKYTPSNGQVDVQLDVLEHHVELVVTDTGIGIAPEDQTHVFEKFYRATNEDVQTITGTGLGLAIAREVARMHGGDIRLESELGHGSTFTIELPFASSDVA